jgi:large subunit ribosomal protein L21
MFAIVEISGEQFKVDSSTSTLRVPYMKGTSAGQEVIPDKVLISQNDGSNISLGGSAGFTATVQGHARGEKVIVFHKKRRKRYRKTNGHTPRYTELAISW